MEAEEKEKDRKAHLELQVRKLEIEADTAVKLKRLELESQARLETGRGEGSPVSTSQTSSSFDVSKYISLVPTFRESEIDSYFPAFERIATALKWPCDVWPLLLQCKVHGKAQEIIAALPLEDSLCYDAVKIAILRAYQLVPEAYRQKFRSHKKIQLTHMWNLLGRREPFLTNGVCRQKLKTFKCLESYCCWKILKRHCQIA